MEDEVVSSDEADPVQPTDPSPFRGEAHVLDVVARLRQEAHKYGSLDETIQEELDRLRE